MKRIYLFLFCFCPFWLSAQLKHELMFQAYLSGDLTYWGDALTSTESNDMPLDVLRQVTNYEYGYIAWCMDKKNTNEAKKNLEKFAQHIDRLEVLGEKQSTILVYRSAFNAYSLFFNKWKMATYASNAINYTNKAVEQDGNNPLALSLKGNVEFFTPKMFGGSKKTALEFYEKAITAFENQKAIENNWNYIATMLCYAQAFEKLGETEKAIEVCQKILKIAPTFVYVRDVYYPQLLK